MEQQQKQRQRQWRQRQRHHNKQSFVRTHLDAVVELSQLLIQLRLALHQQVAASATGSNEQAKLEEVQRSMASIYSGRNGAAGTSQATMPSSKYINIKVHQHQQQPMCLPCQGMPSIPITRGQSQALATATPVQWCAPEALLELVGHRRRVLALLRQLPHRLVPLLKRLARLGMTSKGLGGARARADRCRRSGIVRLGLMQDSLSSGLAAERAAQPHCQVIQHNTPLPVTSSPA